MFFGLMNSPSTFQEMMNVIYKEVIEKHAARGTIIRIYMDDIAIATTGTMQDHIEAVRDVLRVAEQHDLYFKLSKCTFHASSIDYLGVIIEKGMTRMDPVKIAGIKNWPIPTKVKDVRSFLGFCNFYRPFIRGFAHLARPLNELTRKDAEWSWETRHQKAFEELKRRVTTEPVLAHPILTDPFELEVDTSGFAMGAVLLQKKEDGKKQQEDNQNITVLPEQVFVQAMEVLPNLTSQEESVLKPWVDPHQLKQHQGTWYKDGRQVVTGGIEAKRHIIQSHHDSPVHGHPGISKTVQLTERLYWWPKMRQDIMEYVKGCAECQRHKVNNRPTKAPLQPIYPKLEAMPFETIALDFIVKLPICYASLSIVRLGRG
jgi:hypothetical protein